LAWGNGIVTSPADHRLLHLDMLRGLAAIGVVIGHTRSFTILDYAIVKTDSVVVQLLYFLTGLGHQCVIAFFALSGFLVGGPALRGILAGDWVWPRYIVRRLTRLWIVLIPALLLTLGFDTAGMIMGGRLGYEGSFYTLVNSGPTSTSPADLSVTTLLGNALFLQTVVVPTFGSNGPLWSLANEFWYYIIFPFILFGAIGRPWGWPHAIMGTIGLALVVLLPMEMVMLGLIWIAGAISGLVLRTLKRPALKERWLLCLVLGLVIVLTFSIIDKRWPGIPADICLGLSFAALLPVLTLLPSFGSTYNIVADSLAKISYTLYATHFPVLAFIWFVMLAPQKWPFGSTSLACMGSLIAVAVLVAFGMWWLFERNTDRVRNFLESRLLVGAAP
jgi:peptidoglycan/LPS O-acetylase OafA/YrhL